jgi:hypothetical protein
MEDSLFVIQPTHVIDLDIDCIGLSWATGFQTITIEGAASGVPGTLRVDSMTLVAGQYSIVMKTGYNIVGTNTTVRGRILSNSDGVWANTGALAFDRKFVISLLGTAKIDALYLDLWLFDKEPTTNLSVRTYGQIFAECAVSAGSDTLTYTGIAAALPNTTLVCVSAGSGALPAELSAGTDYWVVSASGNTIKLSASSGGSAIDLSAGGPINVHCGFYANWGVSGNTLTKTTHSLANSTAVMVKSTGTLPTPLAINTMYYVVSAAAGAISLALTSGGTALTLGGSPSGTLDVYAGSTGAAPGIGGTNPYTSTMVNVWDDVSSEAEWITTTNHNRIVLADAGPSDYDQQRLTLSIKVATALTLSAAVDSVQYPNALVVLSSRNISIRSAGTSSSQAIVDYGASTFTGNTLRCEIVNTYGTGTSFFGYGVNYGTSHSISGTITGCNYGVYYGVSHTISGTIFGCSIGVYYGVSHTISGTISGCSYGVYYGASHVFSGTITGCGNVIRMPVFCKIIDAISISTSPAIYDRNITGSSGRISYEGAGGTLNAHKIIDMMGDIIKTACDGAGGAPSVDPNAGNDNCIECSSIQSNIANPGMEIFSHRIWATASASKTYTYKMQTTYVDLVTAGRIILTAGYLNNAASLTHGTVTTNVGPATRTNNADWAKTMAVTVNPARTGWLTITLNLKYYESGKNLYIWPNPTIA